jgi:hypothetical protein
VLALVAAAAHLVYLGAPPVNMEFSFIEAGKYFSTGDPLQLAQYFHYEANTLGFPWLVFAIHWLLPGVPIEQIPRLVSIASVPLLAAALLRINRQLGDRINPYLLLLVALLNPLEWTFAGRGTADFIPAALGIFALSLFWNGDRQDRSGVWRRLLASAILGIAAVIKYHAVLLLAGVIVETAFRRRTQYGKILLEWTVSAGPAVIIVAAYVLLIRKLYGFWLTPPEFQNVHRLDWADATNNLSSYAGFLILLTIPFSLALPWRWLAQSRTRLGTAVLIVIAAFLFGFFFVPDNFEINLGPLDPYIGKHLLNGALAVLSIVLALHFAFGLERRGMRGTELARIAGLAAAILFFIVALSFSRPSQRYLLFVVPLFYFFLLPPLRYPRPMWAFALVMSIMLDIYIVLNQIASGVAAIRMTDRIAALGLMSQTFAPVLDPHVGERFFPYLNDEKAYEVVAYNAPNKIAGVRYSVFPGIPFIGKTYSLIPLQLPDR